MSVHYPGYSIDLMASLALCLSATLAVELPNRLSADAISHLCTRGYVVVPNWLPAPLLRAVLNDALALQKQGLARGAQVGSRRSGDEQRRHDGMVRKSQFCPLIPPPRPLAGDIDTRMLLSTAVRLLADELSE
ncbi:MAG: hypothetical protein SGPRY_009985 [Prymnesium sp.]